MQKIMRAEETWQQAGAYYVRIQAMAKKHHITLREEFDEHDTPDTKYIVILDDEFPIATCRFYELDETRAMIGRVVVLPEFRGQGLGTRVVSEAERWLSELGYQTAVIESRVEVTEFYEKQGYIRNSDRMIHGITFDCFPMEKTLEKTE